MVVWSRHQGCVSQPNSTKSRGKTLQRNMFRLNGRRIIVAALAGLAVSGGVAQAASVSTTGSKAWNSGTHLAVQDTKADGANAYANWNQSTGNRIETSGGYGSTNEVFLTTLTSFRACRNLSANPDNCSSWVSP